MMSEACHAKPTHSFLLLLVRPGATSSCLLLVAMPFVTSSFLLLSLSTKAQHMAMKRGNMAIVPIESLDYLQGCGSLLPLLQLGTENQACQQVRPFCRQHGIE